ncbi:mas-related G-protein coupled receptor member H-like [Heteronotia binoei]|uniref:mas-related G-protein coupled receptor member H-like n=1 Tax=Heteronotia binoei TaxID=13085 RepID=UPI0029302147|nr:mas-related G-protein coupled receptor member H-like [Heteronotia binoei]
MDREVFCYSFLTAVILTCVFGCVGNGRIIWLLGFHIKKNTFSTYILHLAVADLGTVAFLTLSLIVYFFQKPSFFVLYTFFLGTCMASLGFLTVISMERCASVLFPRWYQHHRPKRLSTRLSFLIWALAGMFCGLEVFAYVAYGVWENRIVAVIIVVDFWVLPSLVTICTFVLLVGLCCQYENHPPGNLNTVIILMLLFFLIFGGPWIVMNSLNLFHGPLLVLAFFHLFFSVNSSIKLIFYYLVGRQRKCHTTEPLLIKLQRVFQDEGNATEGRELMRMNLTPEEICSIQTA